MYVCMNHTSIHTYMHTSIHTYIHTYMHARQLENHLRAKQVEQEKSFHHIKQRLTSLFTEEWDTLQTTLLAQPTLTNTTTNNTNKKD